MLQFIAVLQRIVGGNCLNVNLSLEICIFVVHMYYGETDRLIILYMHETESLFESVKTNISSSFGSHFNLGRATD